MTQLAKMLRAVIILYFAGMNYLRYIYIIVNNKTEKYLLIPLFIIV